MSNIWNYERKRAPDSRDNRSDSLSVLLRERRQTAAERVLITSGQTPSIRSQRPRARGTHCPPENPRGSGGGSTRRSNAAETVDLQQTN